MKTHGLFHILALFAFTVSAQNDSQKQVSDSLALSSLEEVQLIGIRANDNTPVTFTNITQKELAPRNLGQDIPILLNYLPADVGARQEVRPNRRTSSSSRALVAQTQ